MSTRFQDTPEYRQGGKEVCDRILALIEANLDILYFKYADQIRAVPGFVFNDVDPTGKTIQEALWEAQRRFRYSNLSKITTISQLESDATIRFLKSLYRDFSEGHAVMVAYPADPHRAPFPTIAVEGIRESEEVSLKVMQQVADSLISVRKRIAEASRLRGKRRADALKKMDSEAIRAVVKRLW